MAEEIKASDLMMQMDGNSSPIWVEPFPKDPVYEYKLIDLSKLEFVVTNLNDMGELGWELAATWGAHGSYGILKRKKTI